MFRTMCRAKLHGLTVTEARLDYEGSLTLDSAFMDRVELLPYEQVHVLNITTGTRLETYLIPGEPGSRIVCLNGPAARLGAPGDKVVVLAYGLYSEEEATLVEPQVLRFGEDNEPLPSSPD